MPPSSPLKISTSKWLESFARFGLIAKGVVYCLIGLLAFMAAFEIGKANEDAGNNGVFNFILQQPFGKILLAIVATGLVCYSAWRFIEAIKDTERKGSDSKGYRKRLAYFFSGLAYTGLAFSAIRYLFTEQKDNSDKQQDFVKQLLANPFGQWMTAIAGGIVICIGIYQLFFAISGKYKKHVKQNNLSRRAETFVLRAGRLGYIARGIVWLIIGGLFMKAAWSSDAKQAGDTNHAFHWLESSSYGSYLLAAVALGLICYGAFMFVRARYQPIHNN